jgi:hypothetical protein
MVSAGLDGVDGGGRMRLGANYGLKAASSALHGAAWDLGLFSLLGFPCAGPMHLIALREFVGLSANFRGGINGY